MDSEARSDSDSDYELLTTSFVMPPISALTSGFVTQNAGTNVLLSMPHAVPGEIEAASAASPHDSSSSSHSYDVVPPLPPPCMLTTGFGSSQIRGGGCVGEPLPPPIPRTLSAAGVLETFDKSKIILLDDASDSGGTAMIHRCQIADPRYPDVYILKSQRTEKPNSKWKDYMTREIKFLKLVRGSPYFPQLIGKTSDAIIMTVAEGVDASKWMACRKVPCGDIDVLFKDLKLSDRYEIAFHLAQAFRHLHSLGVTHCDLKPGNFMIKRCAPRGPLLSPFTTPYHTGWVVTVIDFGFAQHPTVGDAVKGGTTFYESPDSVLGSCDTSVDAWAFGMVLGQLLGTEFTASLQNDFDCVRKELMQQAAMNPHVAQRKSRLEKDEFAKMYFSARSKASERSMRTFPVAVRRLMMQCLRYDGSSRPTMEECASTLRRCLEDELCFERLYYHSAICVPRMPSLFDPTTVETSPRTQAQQSKYVQYPVIDLLSRSANVIQLIGGPKSGKSSACKALVDRPPSADPQIAARVFVNGDGGCAAVEFLASLLFQLYRSDSGRRDRSHLACKLSELLPDHSHRVDPSKLCDIVCQCLSTWALADVSSPGVSTSMDDGGVTVSHDDRFIVVVDGLSDQAKCRRRSIGGSGAGVDVTVDFSRIVSALLMMPSRYTVVVSTAVDLGRTFFAAYNDLVQLECIPPILGSPVAASALVDSGRRPLIVTVGIDFRQYSASQKSSTLKEHIYEGLRDVECSSNAIDSIIAGSGDLLYLADNCIAVCRHKRDVLRELAWLPPGSPDALAVLRPYTDLLDQVFDFLFCQWWSPEFEPTQLRLSLRKLLVTALWLDDDRVASIVDGVRRVLPQEMSVELCTMLDAVEIVLRHPESLSWLEYGRPFVNTAQPRLYCRAAVDWFKRYPFACSELPTNPEDVPFVFSASVSTLLARGLHGLSSVQEPVALLKCFGAFGRQFRGLDGQLGDEIEKNIASIVMNPGIVPYLFSSDVKGLDKLQKDAAFELSLVVECKSSLDQFRNLFWKYSRRLVDWPWYFTQLCCQHSLYAELARSDFACQVLRDNGLIPLVPHRLAMDADVTFASLSVPEVRVGYSCGCRSQESTYLFAVSNSNAVVRWDTWKGDHDFVAALDSGRPHVMDVAEDDVLMVYSGDPLCVTEISHESLPAKKFTLRPERAIHASHIGIAKHPRTKKAMVAFVVESAIDLAPATVAVWNPQSGAITALDTPFTDECGFVQVSWMFDEAGSAIVVGMASQFVVFWRVIDCVHGQLVGRVDIDPMFGSCGCMSRFALASRRHVYVGTSNGYVLAVTKEGVLSEQVRTCGRAVPVVDVDGIGSYVACVCEDGAVVTWPSGSTNAVTRFANTMDPVQLWCYIEGREKVIAVLTKDADIQILPFDTPQVLKRTSPPYKLSAISPDGRWLVSSSGFDNRLFLSITHDGLAWEVISEVHAGVDVDTIGSILPSTVANNFHVITTTRKLFRVEVDPVFGVCHIMSGLPSVNGYWIHTTGVNVLALVGCPVDYLQFINLGTVLPSRVPFFPAIRRASSVIPPLEKTVPTVSMDSCVVDGGVLFAYHDSTGTVQMLRIGDGLTSIKPAFTDFRFAPSSAYLRLSRSGDRLAVGTQQYVQLFKLDASTNRIVRGKSVSLAKHLTLGPIHSVRFSWDGKYIATIGGHRSIMQLFECETDTSDPVGMCVSPGLLDMLPSSEKEWTILSALPTSEPVIRVHCL